MKLVPASRNTDNAQYRVPIFFPIIILYWGQYFSVFAFRVLGIFNLGPFEQPPTRVRTFEIPSSLLYLSAKKLYGYRRHFTMVLSFLILLIRDMVVECCKRRFGCETIHPTKKNTSMNLLQMSFVIT